MSLLGPSCSKVHPVSISHRARACSCLLNGGGVLDQSITQREEVDLEFLLIRWTMQTMNFYWEGRLPLVKPVTWCTYRGRLQRARSFPVMKAWWTVAKVMDLGDLAFRHPRLDG